MPCESMLLKLSLLLLTILLFKAVGLLAGKGWYNLNERNYETYCFSKMRSLLAVTRFMMEDTLRSLVMDNHAKFVAFVAAVCSAKVSICLLLCSCLHGLGWLCSFGAGNLPLAWQQQLQFQCKPTKLL